MVATIGFFDGVHLGHQQVLKRLVEVADEQKEQSLVITFATHPKPDMPLLNTLQERKEHILACGVDSVDILDFPSIHHLTAREFMHNILHNRLHITTLLMGYDHHFGSDQIMDFRSYQALGAQEGIRVIYLPQFAPQGKHVSSSVIRNLIEQGDIDRANQLLGYCFSIKGNVVAGRQIGRQIGFPTANIETADKQKIMAGAGVYVVDVKSSQWQTSKRGMLNIGTNPTVGGNECSIEVHLLDYEGNIYGEQLQIFLLHRLRGEIQFNSLAELKRQLEQDRIAVTRYQ